MDDAPTMVYTFKKVTSTSMLLTICSSKSQFANSIFKKKRLNMYNSTPPYTSSKYFFIEFPSSDSNWPNSPNQQPPRTCIIKSNIQKSLNNIRTTLADLPVVHSLKTDQQHLFHKLKKPASQWNSFLISSEKLTAIFLR